MLFIDDLKRKKFIFNEEGGDSSLFRIFLSDGSGTMLLYRVTA
ncbi:MAG: serine acetyltransferase, partial [Methylococcales bacterium]